MDAKTPKTLFRGLQPARFLAAVDGGGSGTRLRLFARDGQLIGQGEAGPSALGLGATQAWGAIGEALQQAAGGRPPAWSELALGLGLSGADSLVQAQAFVAAQPGVALLALDNDGVCTVLGAHGGAPGAVVAAGTGTVGVALRANGSRLLVSGWGWRCGDEGSGAWLGLRAVGHLQRALDGREPASALAAALKQRCGSTRPALLAWCQQAGQTDFAALAPWVFDAAEAGDPAAKALLREAVRALLQVSRALDVGARERKLPLVFAGSIGRRLAPQLPAAWQRRLVQAQGDAVDGALHMLQQALAE